MSLIFLGWIMGFEPTVSRATIWRFNQLSYNHHILFAEHLDAELRSSKVARQEGERCERRRRRNKRAERVAAVDS